MNAPPTLLPDPGSLSQSGDDAAQTRRKRRIASAFGAKAAHYDTLATMQTALLRRLAARITSLYTPAERWMDLGCGNGLLSRLMREAGLTPPVMTGLDLAFQPLRLAKNRGYSGAVQGDLDDLPFLPDSFDGAVAASVVQWVSDPIRALRHCGNAVRSGGHLVFSVFINDSFWEINDIRQNFGLSDAVQCPSDDALLRFFQTPPFELVDCEPVRETEWFPDARSLLKNISATGAAATLDRRLTRRDIASLCERYEARHRRADGVPLTWSALTGTAVKKGPS